MRISNTIVAHLVPVEGRVAPTIERVYGHFILFAWVVCTLYSFIMISTNYARSSDNKKARDDTNRMRMLVMNCGCESLYYLSTALLPRYNPINEITIISPEVYNTTLF